MDIGHIGSNGRIDRGHDRPSSKSVQPSGKEVSQGSSSPADSTEISSAGRDAARSVEALTDKARGEVEDRRELVLAAKARLQSGVLDQPETLRKAASRLLAEGF